MRQYQAHGKKPPRVRRSFIVLTVIAVSIVCAAGLYLYRDILFQKTVHPVPTVHAYEIPVYIIGGPGKLTENRIQVSDNLTEKQKAGLIIADLKTYKIIPSGAELNDMAISADGTMYLDFSSGIIETHISSMADILKTFSIVNSFIGSFRNIDKVQILVEGQPVYSINGAVYTYKPLEFNKDLLED